MAALLVVLGCARHAPVAVAPAPQPAAAESVLSATAAVRVDPDSPYEEGMRAYKEGRTKEAVVFWREAMATETDQVVRQKSLFALASIKLAQAGSESEFNTAMELLDTWAKKSPAGGNGEDPRLLLPALRLLKPTCSVKEIKASLEREYAKKMAQREEQIRRNVQQQLRALESIHQQIQEKKKGLANY